MALGDRSTTPGCEPGDGAAEAGHAILLFDEADSVFGKRTDVKSSNDRYANLETNCLLQRIESFTGICILTSNHETNIDPAFQRRMKPHVRFEMPDQAQPGPAPAGCNLRLGSRLRDHDDSPETCRHISNTKRSARSSPAIEVYERTRAGAKVMFAVGIRTIFGEATCESWE